MKSDALPHSTYEWYFQSSYCQYDDEQDYEHKDEQRYAAAGHAVYQDISIDETR
jgi:hypothetical protein